MWSFRKEIHKINSIISTDISCDSGIDVVFIFDYTNSMSAQIEAAKTGATSIISTINAQSQPNDYRLGLVIADEYNSGSISNYFDNPLYTGIPAGQRIINVGVDPKHQWITAMELMSVNNEITFIAELNKLNDDVIGLPLGGGQATPEPMDIALSRVVENNFSGSFRAGVARYVIMITDAAPSGDDDINDATDLSEINRLRQVCINNMIKVIVLGDGVNYSFGGQFPWRILAEGTGGSWNESFDATTIQTEIVNSCA